MATSGPPFLKRKLFNSKKGIYYEKSLPESPWQVSFPLPSPAQTWPVVSIFVLYILFEQALSVKIGKFTCNKTSEIEPPKDVVPI